jgi:hypothetical protein
VRRRLALTISALTASLALATVTGAAPSWAAPLQIKCKTAVLSAAGVTSFSRCNGNTGGSGTLPNMSPQVIHWNNGQTTTVNISVHFSPPPDPPGGVCPAGQSERYLAGSVLADTTGSASVGAHLVGIELCGVLGGTFSLEPRSKAKI